MQQELSVTLEHDHDYFFIESFWVNTRAGGGSCKRRSMTVADERKPRALSATVIDRRYNCTDSYPQYPAACGGFFIRHLNFPYLAISIDFSI